MPLISFVIPSYNTPSQLLVDCVKSILSVNMGEWGREIVVVDDGSDIPAASVLHDFQDSVSCIRIQHLGVAEARNAALRAAKGKYIQFVDSDDEILTAPYEQCLQILVKEQPDILLFKLTDSTTSKQHKPNLVHNYSTGAEYMVNNNVYASLPSFLFRKTIAEDLTFTPGVYHEDEEFVPLVFLKAQSFISTDAAPYLYRQRTDSIVHSFSSEMVGRRLNDFFNILLRLKYEADMIKANEQEDRNGEMRYLAMSNTVSRKSLDYVINVVRLHKKEDIKLNFFSRWGYINKHLNQDLEKMQSHGLFPLNAKYKNFKHSVFRFVVNHRPLRFFLPLLPI